MRATRLFGEPDNDFERGFMLGSVWQQLRNGVDKVDVVLPAVLVERATCLGEAAGYRVSVRKVNAGLRFLRFATTQ